MTAPVCEDCGDFFDPADKRSIVSKGSELHPRPWAKCPACAIMFHGSEAWAAWNDCNGVFDDTVRCRKADAAQAAADSGVVGTDERIIPVKVIVEPDGRVSFREWADKQWDL